MKSFAEFRAVQRLTGPAPTYISCSTSPKYRNYLNSQKNYEIQNLFADALPYFAEESCSDIPSFFAGTCIPDGGKNR